MMGPRWFRFWWGRRCLNYGHFAHHRRLGPASCLLWWLDGHVFFPRWRARGRLQRMEAKWARQRSQSENHERNGDSIIIAAMHDRLTPGEKCPACKFTKPGAT